MRTEMFIKSFRADAAIAPHRAVKPGATDGSNALNVLATTAIIGVSDSIGAKAAGDINDVVVAGYATVEYGGNVTRGALLTSDTSGRAVTATAGNRLLGIAVVSGVLGDLGTVDVRLGTA